jgi:hypothetical protein
MSDARPVGFLKNCFGQRFGGRQSEVQAERRLERSRNGTTAAVPLTEAKAAAFFHFRPRRARVKPQRNARWSRRFYKSCHLKIIQNNPKENSFCAIIAQPPASFLTDWPDESVIVFFDCAPDGAICSSKSAIMLSDTWGFSAGKHLPVDMVTRGNKLQATADAA